MVIAIVFIGMVSGLLTSVALAGAGVPLVLAVLSYPVAGALFCALAALAFALRAEAPAPELATSRP